MLALVPQLSPAGFVHASGTGDIVAVLPDGESWCRIDTPDGLIAGRMHVRPTYTDLYLGLTGDGIVVYDGLSFGFAWGETSAQWPLPNQTYIQSDQQWILVVRVSHPADDPTLLTIWTEDHGQRNEAVWRFTTPRLVRPFASWTWGGTRWEAPTPMPAEAPTQGNYWRWDEPLQAWIDEPIP